MKGIIKSNPRPGSTGCFGKSHLLFCSNEQGKDQSYESAVGLTQQIEQALQSIRGPDKIWFKSQIQHLQQKWNKKKNHDEVLAEQQHLHQRNTF